MSLLLLLGVRHQLSGLVVLVNCSVHAVVSARLAHRPLPWRLVAGVLVLLLAVIGHGEARMRSLASRMVAAPKLRVGLVQGNIDQTIKNHHAANADLILSHYVPITEEAERAGADLIAWPETAFPYNVPPDIPIFPKDKYRLPRLDRALLLLSADTVEWKKGKGGKRVPEVTNAVFLLRPDLSVVDRYAKHHLVPFAEYEPLGDLLPFIGHIVPSGPPFTPGQRLVTMRFPHPTAADTVSLAPMICFDLFFPEINVAYAKEDPEILLALTNDGWYGYSSAPYQSLAVARMRAVEAGKTVARAAYTGVTAFILPTGEVLPGALDLGPVDLERLPGADSSPRLLLGEIPRLHGKTLYTRTGDLFAYLSAFYSAAILGWALWRSRRFRRAAARRSLEAASSRRHRTAYRADPELGAPRRDCP